MAAKLKLGSSFLPLTKKTWDRNNSQRCLRLFGRYLTSSLSPFSLQEGRNPIAGSTNCSRLGCSSVSYEWQLLLPGAKYSTASMATEATEALSPAVKYLVNTNSISDLSLIKPSGPKARILKGDVLQYLEDLKSGRISPPASSPPKAAATSTLLTQQTQTQPQATVGSTPVPVVKVDSKGFPTGGKAASYVDIPLDDVRLSHARQMVQSKFSTPHVYATASCNVGRLVEIAETLKDDSGQSTNEVVAFLVKAAAHTLERLPECNAIWSTADSPQPLSSVDISVSLASDKGRGFCLLKDVNRWRVQDIVQAVKDVPHAHGSQPPLLMDGNFSIVYLGDFSGISDFTAVLGPSQSAILTVGSINNHPRPGEKSQKSSTITVTLTADARVYRDELVGKWLDEFKRTIDSPDKCGLL